MRSRHLLRLRAVIPRISAPCHSVYSPLRTRTSTSFTFTARSRAEGGKSIGASHRAFYPFPSKPPKGGHFTCAKERTDHLLSTREAVSLTLCAQRGSVADRDEPAP